MHRCIGMSVTICVQNIKSIGIIKHDTSVVARSFTIANGAMGRIVCAKEIGVSMFG